MEAALDEARDWSGGALSRYERSVFHLGIKGVFPSG